MNMVSNKIKLKSSIQYDSERIIIVKSSNNVRISIGLPDSKVVYSEIISVPPYRNVAKSELFADEIIISNIIKRRKTQALVDKILRKIKEELLSNKHKIVSSSL